MAAKMSTMDEEKINSLIQQWLQERGYLRTLRTLQEASPPSDRMLESGFEAEEAELGGQLCSILYDFVEMKNSLEDRPVDILEEERRAAEEDLLSLPEDVSFPSVFAAELRNVHSANIIAVKISPNGEYIATGSADRSTKIVDFETRKVLRTIVAHESPVLSLAFCPTSPHLLLSTAMDGSAAISNAETGEVVATFKNHNKYVIRGAWSPDGQLFATCGHDKHVNIYKVVEGEPGEALEAPKAPIFEKFRSKEFVNIPEAIAFLSDSATLVISIRGDNYLHYLDTQSGEDMKVNLNQQGDDHVSFTVLDLVPSPDGKYLLASTDKLFSGALTPPRKSRLVLYPVGSSAQLRWYYGAVNDELCQDQKLYCWKVTSQKVVAQLVGHTGTVRDLDISWDGKTLISASFDKVLGEGQGGTRVYSLQSVSPTLDGVVVIFTLTAAPVAALCDGRRSYRRTEWSGNYNLIFNYNLVLAPYTESEGTPQHQLEAASPFESCRYLSHNPDPSASTGVYCDAKDLG
ncbi:hypothetical protein GUITHDRAFT_165807 [Guillardia theta CCMP2712]|uniref:LisH domain-containing protein n=1 Tax=Guillardia theta (strain CCMP2712) TaxID=905079 RepID=L1IJF3_GUITC|nr:hypothetical protein GUITHDRAFT_165807 [Guillardia theta CCMP2712]EKX36237.1 hypothetical protein GUITHDRAFT_165807 [Guillardia theta CCMP2712]|eukprot:XP_005823217.1 hypothetical protein GUITHDRAFT_165807 [Guillardia theta CCMP2712]